MKNNWIAKAGAAALIATCAGFASAQSYGNTGLSARIGAFFPTTSSFGSTWFAGGIDYKLNSLSSAMPAGSGYWGLSADYYTYGGNSNIPVVINYNVRESNLTFSLGAGIDFYDEPSASTSSGTGFDAQAAVSYNLQGSPFFLQAKYFLAGRSELRGIGVYAGLHF
jgi:hypothetical protein